MKRYVASYGFKPGMKGVLFGKEIIVDNNGFRLDGRVKPAVAPKIKILFLGDSVTFGLGVEARDAFPYILQRNIPGCAVINSSCVGYGMEDYYNVLNSVSGKIDFDGIIVGICLDDFSSTPQKFIRNYFDEQGRCEKLVSNRFNRMLISMNNSLFDVNSFLRERSKAYILLRDKLMDASKVIFDAQDFTYSAPRIVENAAGSMRKLSEIALRDGKWIIFIVVPLEYQLRENTGSDVLKPQRIIMEAASKASLPVVDMYPYLKAAVGGSGGSLYCDAMHLSKKGHRIISDAICFELMKRGIVQDFPPTKN